MLLQVELRQQKRFAFRLLGLFQLDIELDGLRVVEPARKGFDQGQPACSVTLATDPGDGTTVALEVPGLSISESDTTTSATCSYSIAARTESTNSLWDGTIQVGTNAPADIVVQIVETSAAQAVGLTITDADVTYCAPMAGAGTVTSVGLTMPTGFSVSGSPITDAGTLAVSTTLDGILHGNGAGTISGDAALNDLADVNVAQGAGNDGDLVYYDHAAGAGSKFKGAARSSIGLTEFDNDLSDSYLMLIESPTDKTYTIDGRVAAARTITNFYAKTASGTCTAALKNGIATVGTISVTSTGGSAGSLVSTSVSENARITVTISSTSSAEDLELVVEFTG